MWASLLMLIAAAQSQGSVDVRDWPVEPKSAIAIESRNWPLVIRGHDEGRVRVHDTDAKLTASINANGGQLFVEESERSSTIEINVPRETQLTVTGALADMEIHDIVGDVNASNENNPIYVRQVKGHVRARSLLAAVTIRDIEGAVDAESNMAAVTMEGVRGRVRARSAMAGVSLTQSQSSDTELHATHGVVTFVGGIYAGAKVLLTSHRGPINVELSADSNVAVEISSEPHLVRISGTRNHRWGDDEVGRFSLGDGSGRLLIQSIGGPITVVVKHD